MPKEKEEQQHAPDTARSYERAEPEDETGTHEMGEVRNTPQRSPDSVQGSVRNDQIRQPMTADEITDDGASVDPNAPRERQNADPADAVPAAGTQPVKGSNRNTDSKGASR